MSRLGVEGELEVFGYTFKVRRVENLKDKGESCEGTSNFNKRLIQVKKSLTKDHFYAILLHEVVHMVLEISGHAEKFEDDDAEEAFVIALENGLAPLVNIKGLRWIK